MKTRNFMLLLSLATFAFIACDKIDTSATAVATQAENTAIINDDQVVEATATDIDAISDEALAIEPTASNLLKSASVVAPDSIDFLYPKPSLNMNISSINKILTIDFGASHLGKDGKTRSGKIIITSNNFKTFRKITFVNYKVNDYIIGGTISKWAKTDTIGNRFANVKDSITVTLPNNGGTLKRISNIHRIYYINRTLLNRADDRLVTWGTVSFTNVKGLVTTKTISNLTPLVYRMSCKQIVRGIQIVTRGEKVLTTDFGNGLCDNTATINDGTKEWTITLK